MYKDLLISKVKMWLKDCEINAAENIYDPAKCWKMKPIFVIKHSFALSLYSSFTLLKLYISFAYAGIDRMEQIRLDKNQISPPF